MDSERLDVLLKQLEDGQSNPQAIRESLRDIGVSKHSLQKLVNSLKKGENLSTLKKKNKKIVASFGILSILLSYLRIGNSIHLYLRRDFRRAKQFVKDDSLKLFVKFLHTINGREPGFYNFLQSLFNLHDFIDELIFHLRSFANHWEESFQLDEEEWDEEEWDLRRTRIKDEIITLNENLKEIENEARLKLDSPEEFSKNEEEQEKNEPTFPKKIHGNGSAGSSWPGNVEPGQLR